jgi:hypothetical protein
MKKPPKSLSLWKNANNDMAGFWTVWAIFGSQEQAQAALARYRCLIPSVLWEIAPTFPNDVGTPLMSAPSTYPEWPPRFTEHDEGVL